MGLRQNHLSGLDGLRALAVASVVAYHLNYSWARGGYLGVDLFFVLSGFLITTLLLEEHQSSGRIAWAAFWGRRARRLLPALYLMIGVVVVFPWLMTELGRATAVATLDLTQLRGFAVSSFFYVANWFAIASGHSYFAQFAAPSPLAHTWSLAIEEQFYLLWPFVVFALARGGVLTRRRLGWGVSLGIGVVSSVLMALLFRPGHESSLNFVYNATFTRFFDLAAGATLAWLVVSRPVGDWWRRWADPVGGVALATLLAFMVLAGTASRVPTTFMFEGGFALCAVVATVLVAAVRVPEAWLTRGLSWAPLQGLGRVSYGVYLWHWPIIVYVTPALVHRGGHTLLAIRLALLALLTVVSYYVVELPIRQRRWTVTTRRTVSIAGTAVTAALIVVMTSAAIFPTPDVRAELARYAPAPVPAGSGGLVGTVSRAWLSGQQITPHHRLRVMLLGDSVTYYSGAGLEAALNALPQVRARVRAFPGFGLRQRSFWSFYLSSVGTFHPKVVIIEAEYDDVFALSHPRIYHGLLDDFVRQLRHLGVRDVLLATTPQVGPPPSMGQTGSRAVRFRRLFIAANRDWQVAARAVVHDFPGIVQLAPVASSLDLHGAYSAWLPPPRDPTAPRPTWDRVRMVDNTHLCPLGTVQYGAALGADVALVAQLRPARHGWWFGRWISSKITLLPPSPTACPNDHP